MYHYILLDSAQVPSIWHYLTFKNVAFEPLYRYDSTKIKSVIPYIIQLNWATQTKTARELLTKEAFHSGLIIHSHNTLTELADKLGYFYHVVNSQREPLLQRFFDLPIFPDFIADLSQTYRDFLFSNKTVFYYLSNTQEVYHKISYQDNIVKTESITIDTFYKDSCDKFNTEKNQ